VQKFRSGQGDIDVGELVLEPGARASGFVHDTLGIPCAGVRMSMTHPNRRTGVLPVRDETLSAADGRFAFDNAPAARCTLEARSDDLREAKLEVDLSGGEPRTDIDVILPELHGADSISGVVMDPDGNPVPNALIAETETAGPEPRLSISTGCDERGRFRIDGRPGGVFELTVRDRRARWCGVRRGDIRSGTHDVVIALDGSRSFLLRVRDASGVPVERFGFDRVSSVMYDYVRDEITQHPGGEVRMASDLVPFDLRVVACGYHSETIAGLDPDHLPAVVDVALRHACMLRGSVSSEGRPVQFARITIGDSHLLDNAPPRSMLGDARAPEAVTDASGAFELTVEGTGTVRLRAQNGARLAPLTSDIAVKPGEDVAGIAIELATTGSIEGAVFDSTGLPRAGVAVAAASDGKPVEATHADEHGAFRLAGLPPGDYDVTTMLDRGLVHFDTHEPPCVAAAQSWRFHVEPGTTQRADLHLLESARCHLALAIPNPPQSTWHVETWIHAQRTGADVRDSSLHANDALDVEMIDPFDAEVRVECERLDWPQFRIARQSFDRGTREVSLSVTAGRIYGSLASPFAAGETVKLTWHGSSADARAETTVDATGQFVLECAPVGECSLARSTRPHDARTVTVKSAESSRVDNL
jgi:hypothetical protein